MVSARVFDALNDPVMGIRADRTKSRWGKFRPYLKYAPWFLLIFTITLFIPITGATTGLKIAFVAVTYVLWSMAYTAEDISLWGVVATLTSDEEKRTKVIAAARLVGMLTGIGMFIGFFPLKDFFGNLNIGLFGNTGRADLPPDVYFSEAQGYFFSAISITIVSFIMLKLLFPNVRERVQVENPAISLKETIKIIFSNKAFMQIVISGIFGTLKTLVMTAGVYFAKWVMGNGNEGIWVLTLATASILGNVVSIIITPLLSKKIGKKNLYLWSSYIGVIPSVIMFVFCLFFLHSITAAPVVAFMWVSFTLMSFFGGFAIVLPMVMMADCVDYMEYKTGRRDAGVYFAGTTLVIKMTAGIAFLVSYIVFAIVNYTETITKITSEIKEAADAGLEYTLNFVGSYHSVAIALLILITLMPAIGFVLQALPMHKYELTEKVMAEVSAGLKEKRLTT
jgi:Na+/melibiose symporter-like transporter